MKTLVHLFLLACSVLLSGCGHAGQKPEELAREKEPPEMIQIQNLTLTDKTLTLDYRVSNPFEDDIWVCYDTSVYGKQDAQHVATRIDGEAARIKLCFNLESVGGVVFEDPPAIGKYVRLPPEESCSGRIVRNLPIRDYVREWRAERKEHKQIVLHCTVFEIGYIRTFGPGWKKLLDSRSEKLKKEPIKPKPIVSGPYYLLPSSPLVTKETLDGQLREVMYLHGASFVEKEESADALITDVNIPCSVVVDDK